MLSCAPAINLVTSEGKTLSLASLKGRWVLINFWASWCAPCIDELPNLVRAQDEYSGLGLQIIGPALDEASAVKPMLARFNINYPVTADFANGDLAMRSEEHTSELQSLMRISYAVLCWKNKNK